MFLPAPINRPRITASSARREASAGAPHRRRTPLAGSRKSSGETRRNRKIELSKRTTKMLMMTKFMKRYIGACMPRHDTPPSMLISRVNIPMRLKPNLRGGTSLHIGSGRNASNTFAIAQR